MGVHGPLPAGIAARAADPAGGLAWGIRVVHTTGYTCVQLGRLRGSRLGLLGRDGLAGNNGRFYPMGPSTTYQARCAPNDGGGHAYMTVELGAQPASGAGGGYKGMSMCRTAAEEAGLTEARARLKQRGITARTGGTLSMPVCPRGDLRFVQYGLLGPDATSITFRVFGAAQSARTGEDGAYLVVGPSTPAFCGRFVRGTFCGGNGVGPNAIGGGMIEAVHYRNAPTCRLDSVTSRLPVWGSQLPARRVRAGQADDDRPTGGRPDPRARDQCRRVLPGPRRRADQRTRTRSADGPRAVSPLFAPDEQPSGERDPRHPRDLLLDCTPNP